MPRPLTAALLALLAPACATPPAPVAAPAPVVVSAAAAAESIAREGHARFAADDCEAALPLLARAVALDPERTDALRDIATCKKLAGDRAGACAAADELVRRDQLRGASARATLEMLCPAVTARATPKAAPPPEPDHTVDPDDVRAGAERVFRDAHTAFIGGDCDAAMPGLTQAAIMDPTFAEPLRDAAMCQRNAGNTERACSAAREFIKRKKLEGAASDAMLGVFCDHARAPPATRPDARKRVPNLEP